MPRRWQSTPFGQSKHGCPETSASPGYCPAQDNFALQCGRRLAFHPGHLRGSSPLMKYSVWLKGTYCSGLSLHPDGQTPALRYPGYPQPADGRVKQPAAVFLRASDTGHAGGRRLLRITRSLKASIFRPSHRTAPVPSGAA